MNPRILKYILDILSVIDEMERLLEKIDRNFIRFSEDFTAIRTAERDLEIVGEALNKLKKENPQISISDSKKIISLRNLIIHSYDSVDNEIIWGILIKDIPRLKKELQKLKSQEL
ncbi:MAG: HepT-like ribonuclease domain-containing protein [Cyclobacteriaceae bacterium]